VQETHADQPQPRTTARAIVLDTTSIETVIETALRQYIDQCNCLKASMNKDTGQSFGESIGAFRKKYNISETDIDPDAIWGDVRDRNFVS
jgi:hypothetical protein